MQVTFDHRQQEAEHIYTYWFKPEHPVDYIAGQFAEFSLPHDAPDSRGIRRWFTLSSSPTDGLLSVTTKFMPSGTEGSSFKRQLQSLKPGTPLTMSDAMGDFVLPRDDRIPLLLVAGGMGITPVHSMIRWLEDKHEERPLQLIYSVSKPGDLLFLEVFRRYGLAPTILQKRITASYILDMHPDPDSLIYISGPEAMVETLEHDLQDRGISNQRLVTDSFPGYSQI
jgi:ferredoxin-NADP reductase